MIVSLIDEPAAMAGLAAEWAGLWDRCPDATPFQHPAWLLPWWGAFGNARPLVAVARSAGRLEGLLPAYVLEEASGPKLLPIGAGTSDYLDCLGQGLEDLVGALLARAAFDGVARCDWIEVPPWSGFRAEVPVPGWESALSAGEACPVLTLGSPDGVRPAMRRKLRMSRHRADRVGGWAMQEAGAGVLHDLVALHQARWTGSGEAGVLADPAVLACLRAALPRLEAAGLLRARLLLVAGVPAASILALLSPGRIYFYLSGYDVAQHFVSPGTLLVGAMLEEATAEGIVEAHFLRGGEPYKYAWGATDRLNATRSWWRH